MNSMDKPTSEKDVIESLEEKPKGSLPDRNSTVAIMASPQNTVSSFEAIYLDELIQLKEKIKELEAENERLLKLHIYWRGEWANCSSKLSKVRWELEPLLREGNAKYLTTDELSIFNRILDLIK